MSGIIHHDSIKATSKQIEKAEKLLAGIPGGAEKALMRALNRAIESAKAEAVRAVGDVYTAKPKTVRAGIFLRKASPKKLEANLVSSESNLRLKEFKVSPKADTTGNKRRPIRAEIKKGRQLDDLERAFVWDGHVYEREGDYRIPIRPRFGPGVPIMLNNDAIVDRVMEQAVKSVDKALEHEIEHILDEVKP